MGEGSALVEFGKLFGNNAEFLEEEGTGEAFITEDGSGGYAKSECAEGFEN